jgi:hypothetical protein
MSHKVFSDAPYMTLLFSSPERHKRSFMTKIAQISLTPLTLWNKACGTGRGNTNHRN